MIQKKITTLVFALSFLGIANCGPSEKTLDLIKKGKSIFGTLPQNMSGSENDTPELIALGKKLYMDTALSENNTMSCNTCHNILNKNAGVDNKKTSPGALGQNGERNTPTVLNAGFHAVQFWDGRAKDLNAQVKSHILNQSLMAMPNEKAVEDKISAIEDYKELFEKAFPESPKVSLDNIATAISAFERTLRTTDKFDEFIAGNHKALNEQEQKGLETFMASGCTTCHNGPLFGGKMFMKMGVVNPYENTEDTGKFKVTGQEADQYIFKVPSLRNVALTAPYYHDGGAPTLEEAVKQMAWLQLGKKLEAEDVSNITAFLNSLTDKERVK
jgi:cytochrome c peroxidase